MVTDFRSVSLSPADLQMPPKRNPRVTLPSSKGFKGTRNPLRKLTPSGLRLLLEWLPFA